MLRARFTRGARYTSPVPFFSQVLATRVICQLPRGSGTSTLSAIQPPDELSFNLPLTGAAIGNPQSILRNAPSPILSTRTVHFNGIGVLEGAATLAVNLTRSLAGRAIAMSVTEAARIIGRRATPWRSVVAVTAVAVVVICATIIGPIVFTVVIRATVVALLISLLICLTVLLFVGLFVAVVALVSAVGMLGAVVHGATRTAIVATVSAAVAGSHLIAGVLVLCVSILPIIAPVVAIATVGILVALVISCFVSKTVIVVIVFGLLTILASSIVRGVILTVAHPTLIVGIVRVVIVVFILIMPLAMLPALLRLIRDGECWRAEHDDDNCQSSRPYCWP